MKLLRFLVFGILVFMLWPECIAAEWQWSVQIPGIISNETDDHPQAFLWIPSDCAQVRGVMIGTHNMTEETLFENLLFREKMSEIGMGLIWITPGWDQKWDVSAGSQRAFEQMLEDFAAISGYNELKYVPIVPFGHSRWQLILGILQHGIPNGHWLSFPFMETHRVLILPDMAVITWSGGNVLLTAFPA